MKLGYLLSAQNWTNTKALGVRLCFFLLNLDFTAIEIEVDVWMLFE